MKISGYLLVTLLLIASCVDKKKDQAPLVTDPVYTNACCCDPTYPAGSGLVFIPTMFTPNGDGVNDLLHLLGNQQIKYIYDVEIRNATNALLYTIDTAFGNAAPGNWNGIINGVVFHKGVLNIQCKAIDNNNTITQISAQSCAYSCDSVSNAALPNILNCKFESMVDPGTLGTPYASGESFCQ